MVQSLAPLTIEKLSSVPALKMSQTVGNFATLARGLEVSAKLAARAGEQERAATTGGALRVAERLRPSRCAGRSDRDVVGVVVVQDLGGVLGVVAVLVFVTREWLVPERCLVAAGGEPERTSACTHREHNPAVKSVNDSTPHVSRYRAKRARSTPRRSTLAAATSGCWAHTPITAATSLRSPVSD